MLCSNAIEEDVKTISVIDNIDIALHKLGMLSSVTDARCEYLKENNQCLSILQMNTRYVSNVTIGFRMKKATTSHRLKPYIVPERSRTKSENSDTHELGELERTIEHILEVPVIKPTTQKYTNTKLKRHKSLENLKIDSEDGQPSKDMEIVSNSIQKLTVDEC